MRDITLRIAWLDVEIGNLRGQLEAVNERKRILTVRLHSVIMRAVITKYKSEHASIVNKLERALKSILEMSLDCDKSVLLSSTD